MKGKKYWKEQVELILKEQNPKKYSLLKSNGELEKLKEVLAEWALEEYVQMWDWLMKHNPAEKQYPNEELTIWHLVSAPQNNEMTAREMVQEDLKNRLLS